MPSLEYEINFLSKMVEIDTESVSKKGYDKCAAVIVEEAKLNSLDVEIVNGEVTKIFKALASETRWKILKLIKNGDKLDISRLAESLKQTEANISAQVKILEKAGLIKSYYEPGERGVRKICEPACDKLIIKLI